MYSYVFGHSKQLSLNKFFDPSCPSRRKGRDGEKGKGTEEKNGGGKKKEKTNENSGHYGVCHQSTAQTTTPEQRPLELAGRTPILKKMILEIDL